MIKRIVSLMLLAVICLTVPLEAAAYIPYKTPYLLGDVDKNGAVTAADALLALQCSVGKVKLDYDAEDSADIDVDWKISATDALQILQCSVGKTELANPEHPYAAYTLNAVEPTGLEKNTLYVVSTKNLRDKGTTRNYHILRLLVCIQGLVNRGTDTHKTAISLLLDRDDEFWINYMQREGATYSEYNRVNILGYDNIIEKFLPFIKERGLVVWDPNVPSTANVASTICGLDGYLPVMYDTGEKSLYTLLTQTYGVKVKQNLCGMFEDAALGKKIAGTPLDSTGSSKCDAYVWALDKYMDRCNPEHIAYTLDGAANVPSNPHYKGPNGNSAEQCGIPNHDYFVMKQMFFMDLTSYPGEAASDDPTQPVGTDHNTLIKILEKRYEIAKGNFGIVQGFIPWHQKYTTRREPKGSLDAPRLEWHFVETVGCYNCGIEADAAGPQYMSNGSFYAKYELMNEPVGNAPAKDVKYDPDTYYYCQVYSGDFDCSPWLKARALDVWSPSKLGKVYSTYNYSTTHIMRVPQIYDWIYENKTDYEYLTGGEGAAYVMTASMFKGFKGKEAMGTERTLEDGDRAYYRYLRPYYDYEKLSLGGKLINGFTVMGATEMIMQNKIASSGSFVYRTNAPAHIYMQDNVPYISQQISTAGTTATDSYTGEACFALRSNILKGMREGGKNFTAFGYLNKNSTTSTANYFTPDQLAVFIEEFVQYVQLKDPDHKYQYVDIETFFDLMVQAYGQK